MSGIGTNGAGPRTTEAELSQLPMAQLLRRLSDQTSLLMREEVALAKAELAEKGRRASRGAGMFGGAAVCALYGVGALVAAAILALSLAVASWLAALIVAAVLFLVAGVAALAGRRQVRRATPPLPEQTVETVKEDVQWATTRARTARQH
ncbi:phage holin family protein [Conexibacter arvalis]|uniref:Membrane protein n=1 Tax=Conexibacter arvalis TaxID=912552 RepID=A0A840IAY3_9ACTN|nr:phage holin family protein [Conexibacter arvalis]MBB4662059.1 membrane protein [Conexibacter arvalis]